MMERETVRRTEDRHHSIFHQTFESFYKTYYPVVLGYLCKKTGSISDAEDIAGKVFLYCFEKWDEYDPQKASQKTWLFLIVRSRWIDSIRRKRDSVNIDLIEAVLPEKSDSIENALKLEALRQELAEALGQLPEKQRDAVILRYFGNYEDTDIAAHLGTTPGNVRVMIHRGLEKLRKIWPMEPWT